MNTQMYKPVEDATSLVEPEETNQESLNLLSVIPELTRNQRRKREKKIAKRMVAFGKELAHKAPQKQLRRKARAAKRAKRLLLRK